MWDTGTQVSIVSKSWFSKDLPLLELRKIEEMLGRVKDWT